MIRPHKFSPNLATASDNYYQRDPAKIKGMPTAQLAFEEVTSLADGLTRNGVEVHIFEDLDSKTPDSVFPNNWFSTHADGRVAIYPMYTDNRRAERRSDVIDMLKKDYLVKEIVDYSDWEQRHQYLEGTGAMVLDHAHRIAYVARSNRVSEQVLGQFCRNFSFEPVVFDAADGSGNAIYHTNVMMCIGTNFAVAGLESIGDHAQRVLLRCRLEASGREVINVSQKQLREFAGNAIELRARDGLVLAMSTRAYRSLRDEQVRQLDRCVRLLTFEVPTIELAGGSVRCMLAGIHLERRTAARNSARS